MNGAEHFEIFGAAATSLSDPTVSAGRHSFQREAESRIADDVAVKLGLGPSDRLLEVGCGTGNVLRPLAPHAGAAVGVDHGAVLEAFSPIPGNVELVPGHWPDVTLEGDFSKVLVYSVLQCLGGPEQGFEFIEHCLDRLRPGGRLMLGDIPNSDAAARFAATEFGQRFLADWAEQVAASKTDEDLARDRLWADAPALERYIDDRFVMEVFTRYRGRGYEVYVLPQPVELPFSYTREDLMIYARP